MKILEDSIKEIVALFSGGASLIRWLIENDSNYGKHYIFTGALTDKEDASGIDFLQKHDIPVIVCSLKKFKEQNPNILKEDAREAYFKYIGEMIYTEYNPHLILCAGFMKIISESFLDMFPEKVWNVHPADLRVEGSQTKQRLYVGDKAVQLAYEARVAEMHATIHVVTPQVDAGPIVCVSPPYEVDYATQTWEQVQSIMKNVCDGPAGMEALRLFCHGEYTLVK